MKKYWYVVVLAVSLFLLGACVTDTTPPPPSYPSSVSDLEDVSESDNLYVVTVLTDDDVQALITAVSDYVAPQESDSPASQDSVLTLKSMPDLMSESTDDASEVYNGLINNVFRKHERAKEKLRKMVESSKGLVGVTDLKVEITGAAKEEIIDALNALFEPDETIGAPDTLILDYRDFMYLRALAGGLLSIYDSEVPVYGWFADLDEITALTYYLENIETEEPPENLFKDEALEHIGSFVEYLDSLAEGQPPLEISTTWTELETLVTSLANIAPPTDELNAADIFVEGFLQIGGMDFLVETLDYFVEIINGVYVFEDANTDANGWSDDGKTSLFEYAATLSDASSNDDISIKSGLDEDISLEDMPAEITELNFGSVDLLKGANGADLLGELNKLLPEGELAITTKASTSIQSEGSGEIPIEVSGSLGVDFGALSSDGTLALLNNNLGVKSKIIDELRDIKIWEIIATPDPGPTPEQIGEIIGIILDNLTFTFITIEENSLSVSMSINIDDSISEEVTIETEGITIDQLIVELIVFINALIEQLMPPL